MLMANVYFYLLKVYLTFPHGSMQGFLVPKDFSIQGLQFDQRGGIQVPLSNDNS